MDNLDNLLETCISEELSERVKAYHSLVEKLTSLPPGIDWGLKTTDIMAMKMMSFIKEDMFSSEDNVSYEVTGFLGCFLANEKLMDLLTLEKEQEIFDCLVKLLEETKEKTVLSRGLWSLAQSKFECEIYSNNIVRLLNLINDILICDPTSIIIYECLQVMKSLIESIPKEIINKAEIWLPKIFAYLFHDSLKVRGVAYSCFNFCHMYSQQHNSINNFNKLFVQLIPILKNQYCKQMTKLVEENCTFVLKIWRLLVIVLGKDLHNGTSLINGFLEVVEKAFKNSKPEFRVDAFKCWHILIMNFSSDGEVLAHPKRLKLLVAPLKANNAKTEDVAYIKLHTWWFLICNLSEKIETYFDLIVAPLLKFCFNSNRQSQNNLNERTLLMSGTNTPCTKYSSLLLKSMEVFMFILNKEYALECGYEFTIPEPNHCILNSSLFQKNHNLIFGCMTDALISLDSSKKNHLQIGMVIIETILKHINDILKEHLNKKESVDVMKEFLNILNFLESQSKSDDSLSVFVYKTMEKIIDGRLAFPRNVLHSRSYYIPVCSKVRDMMNGNLSNYLIHKLATPVLLHLAPKESGFLQTWMTVLQKSKPSTKLVFFEAVMEELESAVPILCPKQPDTLVKLWATSAQELHSYVDETQQINQGDNSEHDYTSIYNALTFPLNFSENVSSVKNKTYEELINRWTRLWYRFTSLTPLTPTAEPNSEAEFVAKRILSIVNEKLPHSPDSAGFSLALYAEVTAIIVEKFRFREIGKKPKKMMQSPLKPKKRPHPLHNLASLLELLVLLMERALQMVSHWRQKAVLKLASSFYKIFSSISQDQIVWVVISSVADVMKKALQVNPTAKFNSDVENCFISMWNAFCGLIECRVVPSLTQDKLSLLSPVISAALQSSHLGLRQRARLMWSTSLASTSLTIPDHLYSILKSVGLPPASISEALMVSDSQNLNPKENIPAQVSGSFLNKEKRGTLKFSSPKISPKTKQEGKHNSPSILTPKNKKVNTPGKSNFGIDDLKEEEFVKVESPKPTKRVLTPHQVEKMKDRRSHIPALYNDMSQSLSQLPSQFISQDSYDNSSHNSYSEPECSELSFKGKITKNKDVGSSPESVASFSGSNKSSPSKSEKKIKSYSDEELNNVLRDASIEMERSFPDSIVFLDSPENESYKKKDSIRKSKRAKSLLTYTNNGIYIVGKSEGSDPLNGRTHVNGEKSIFPLENKLFLNNSESPSKSANHGKKNSPVKSTFKEQNKSSQKSKVEDNINSASKLSGKQSDYNLDNKNKSITSFYINEDHSQQIQLSESSSLTSKNDSQNLQEKRDSPGREEKSKSPIKESSGSAIKNKSSNPNINNTASLSLSYNIRRKSQTPSKKTILDIRRSLKGALKNVKSKTVKSCLNSKHSDDGSSELSNDDIREPGLECKEGSYSDQAGSRSKSNSPLATPLKSPNKSPKTCGPSAIVKTSRDSPNKNRENLSPKNSDMINSDDEIPSSQENETSSLSSLLLYPYSSSSIPKELRKREKVSNIGIKERPKRNKRKGVFEEDNIYVTPTKQAKGKHSKSRNDSVIILDDDSNEARCLQPVENTIRPIISKENIKTPQKSELTHPVSSPGVTPSKVTRSGRRIIAPKRDMPEPMTPPGPNSKKSSSSEQEQVLNSDSEDDSVSKTKITSKLSEKEDVSSRTLPMGCDISDGEKELPETVNEKMEGVSQNDESKVTDMDSVSRVIVMKKKRRKKIQPQYVRRSKRTSSKKCEGNDNSITNSYETDNVGNDSKEIEEMDCEIVKHFIVESHCNAEMSPIKSSDEASLKGPTVESMTKLASDGPKKPLRIICNEFSNQSIKVNKLDMAASQNQNLSLINNRSTDSKISGLIKIIPTSPKVPSEGKCTSNRVFSLSNEIHVSESGIVFSKAPLQNSNLKENILKVQLRKSKSLDKFSPLKSSISMSKSSEGKLTGGVEEEVKTRAPLVQGIIVSEENNNKVSESACTNSDSKLDIGNTKKLSKNLVSVSDSKETSLQVNEVVVRDDSKISPVKKIQSNNSDVTSIIKIPNSAEGSNIPAYINLKSPLKINSSESPKPGNATIKVHEKSAPTSGLLLSPKSKSKRIIIISSPNKMSPVSKVLLLESPKTQKQVKTDSTNSKSEEFEEKSKVLKISCDNKSLDLGANNELSSPIKEDKLDMIDVSKSPSPEKTKGINKGVLVIHKEEETNMAISSEKNDRSEVENDLKPEEKKMAILSTNEQKVTVIEETSNVHEPKIKASNESNSSESKSKSDNENIVSESDNKIYHEKNIDEVKPRHHAGVKDAELEKKCGNENPENLNKDGNKSEDDVLFNKPKNAQKKNSRLSRKRYSKHFSPKIKINVIEDSNKINDSECHPADKDAKAKSSNDKCSPDKENSKLSSSVSTPERKNFSVMKVQVPGSRAAIMLACAKRTMRTRDENLDASSDDDKSMRPNSSRFSEANAHQLSPKITPSRKRPYSDVYPEAKPWAKHEPSPGASPCGSILKKKFEDESSSLRSESLESVDGSPLPSKSRRVSFADPPVSESVEIPPSPKVLKGHKAQKRLDMTQAINSAQPLVCDSGRIEDEDDVPLSLLTCSEPIYPLLNGCQDPISSIAKVLTSSSLVDALIIVFKDHGIKTVGDFSKLSPMDLKALPIRSPKYSVALTGLKKHYDSMQSENEKSNKSRNEDLEDVLPEADVDLLTDESCKKNVFKSSLSKEEKSTSSTGDEVPVLSTEKNEASLTNKVNELKESRFEPQTISKEEKLAISNEEKLAISNEDKLAISIEEEKLTISNEEEMLGVSNEEEKAISSEEEKLAISSEEKLAIPYEEKKLAIPDEEEKLAIPNEEEKLAIPDEEEKLAIPDEEEKLAIPDEKEKLAIPEEEEKLAITDEEEKLAIPDEEEKLAIPDEEEKLAIPDEEEKLAILDEEEKLAIPDEEEKLAIPDEEEKLAIPDEEENQIISIEKEESRIFENEKVSGKNDDSKTSSKDDECIVLNKVDGAVAKDIVDSSTCYSKEKSSGCIESPSKKAKKDLNLPSRDVEDETDLSTTEISTDASSSYEVQASDSVKKIDDTEFPTSFCEQIEKDSNSIASFVGGLSLHTRLKLMESVIHTIPYKNVIDLFHQYLLKKDGS